MDVILEAADALAAIAKKEKETAIVKIQQKLDELNKKLELVLSLLKAQKKQNKEPRNIKTRSVIKIASSITKRTSRTSSSPPLPPLASPSSTSFTSKTTKTSKYYAKYPEIKKKFWGVGPGRRSTSILQKMDELIAKLRA